MQEPTSTDPDTKPEPEKRAGLPRATKIALYSTLSALLIFLIWALFYPIQQGAPAQGTVVVWGYRKVIQHPYGGTIKELLVRDGDRVTRGQPLIILDDQEVRAQYAQVRAEYFTSLLQRERLLAERAGRLQFSLPKEIAGHLREPDVQRLVSAQQELLTARRTKFETDRRLILQTISGLEAYLAELNRQLSHLNSQQELLQRQISDLKPLTEEGYFPRNRFLELVRQLEAVKTQISETLASIRRTEASILEQKQRLNVLERDYFREIEAELSEVEKRLTFLQEAYFSLRMRLERTVITSPEDGVVMALRFHHAGQVIRPAEPIMEIVPAEASFVIEAKLSPLYIEDVRVGQEVDLRFVAIDPRKTPVLTGRLVYVSPDALVEQTPGGYFHYYLLRIEPAEESIKEIHRLGKEIIPGMPVEVVVKTGKRPFISYLLKPFLDRLATAFLR